MYIPILKQVTLGWPSMWMKIIRQYKSINKSITKAFHKTISQSRNHIYQAPLILCSSAGVLRTSGRPTEPNSRQQGGCSIDWCYERRGKSLDPTKRHCCKETHSMPTVSDLMEWADTVEERWSLCYAVL